MAGNHPKLTDEQWTKQRTAIKRVAKVTRAAIEKWAKIANGTIGTTPPDEWRWLLADLRNRAQRDKDPEVECPYTVSYLLSLVETNVRFKGDWDRGVSPSVLIEGRNLPNAIEIVKDEVDKHGDMSVLRMKSHVSKKANKDKRPIEEIEEEIKAKQDTVKERGTRQKAVAKIEADALRKPDNLLPTMREQINAFRTAAMRLRSQGHSFNATEVDLTLDSAQSLTSLLEELRRSHLSEVA